MEPGLSLTDVLRQGEVLPERWGVWRRRGPLRGPCEPGPPHGTSVCGIQFVSCIWVPKLWISLWSPPTAGAVGPTPFSRVSPPAWGTGAAAF